MKISFQTEFHKDRGKQLLFACDMGFYLMAPSWNFIQFRLCHIDHSMTLICKPLQKRHFFWNCYHVRKQTLLLLADTASNGVVKKDSSGFPNLSQPSLKTMICWGKRHVLFKGTKTLILQQWKNFCLLSVR